MKMNVRTITLVNAWSDDNKGDLGIYEGTLSLIRRSFPEAVVNVVSMFTGGFDIHHRHLARFDKDIKIFPPVFAKNISIVLKFLLQMYFGSDLKNKTLRIIKESDLVIALGGHHFHNYKSWHFKSYFRLLFLSAPLIFCRKYKVPYVFLGHSIGPFFRDVISKAWMGKVLGEGRGLYVRESISFNVATKELSIDKKKVRVVPDMAFGIKPRLTDRVKILMRRNGLRRKKFWIVTVRKWFDPKVNERLVVEMDRLIRSLFANGRVERMALVAQGLGPFKMEDDRDITDALYKRLKGMPVVKIEKDLDTGELAAFYGQSEFLIGTRFHSVIFAAVGGTPAFAISYFGSKAKGIMKMLGADKYCVEAKDIESGKMMKMLTDANIRSMEKRLVERVEKLKKELDRELMLYFRSALE